jgi:hypothetical protein
MDLPCNPDHLHTTQHKAARLGWESCLRLPWQTKQVRARRPRPTFRTHYLLLLGVS